MKRKRYVTSLRTDENVVKYKINGRIYTFIIAELDDSTPYGYCHTLKKWAWLFPNYIHDEDGNRVLAERI